MKDLIIVAQHEQPLRDYLSQHFRVRPDVVVILDRWKAERRRRVPRGAPHKVSTRSYNHPACLVNFYYYKRPAGGCQVASKTSRTFRARASGVKGFWTKLASESSLP